MKTVAIAAALLSLFATAAPAQDFTGSWLGSGEGHVTAEIRKGRQRPEFMVIALETTRPGCQGDVVVYGVPSGNRLSAINDDKGDPDALVCRIDLTLNGNVLEVEETSCIHFHGASCGFTGELRRR